MLKILIIEDEAPARQKLKNYLNKIDEAIEIIGETETVEETTAFLQSATHIDLIFSDIELRDGNVFEVYQQIKVDCPIIFTTAYDQFWMNAFETNGIEYLLKPFPFERFKKAWQKYASLKSKMAIQQDDIFQKIEQYYQRKLDTKPSYKEYIPVKNKHGIYFLKVQDIALIQSDYGIVIAFDCANKKHTLNQATLTAIQEMLDPEVFFKINRSELVNRKYVEKISRYTKNTVAIHIKSHVLKTSQANTAAFNSWMGL